MNKFFLFSLVACFAQVSLAVVQQTTASPVISVRDYYSMLMAVPDSAELYSDAMAADPEGCGIIRIQTERGCDYKMVAGMEEQPMQGIEEEQQEYYEQWLEQKGEQERKELTSPLMMLGEHQKIDPEAAERKSEEAERRQEALRQKSNMGSTSSSSSEERSQNAVAIGEHQPPLTELNFGGTSDEISAITDAEMTPTSGYRSMDFSPTNSSDRLHQAQDRLRKAREENITATNYFDRTLQQWKFFKEVQQAKSQHESIQHQFSLAHYEWSQSIALFRQADVNFRTALHNHDPLQATLYEAAGAQQREMFQKYQSYQTLLFQEQSARQRYHSIQQIAGQHQVVEGVNYGTLLEEAQQRVTRTADQLQRSEEEVRRAKFEKPITPINRFKETLQKSHARSAAESVPKCVETSSSATAETKNTTGDQSSGTSAVEAKKISYQDQGTQISPDDLAAWERGALLKKQDRWRASFHQMVEQWRVSKKRAKEAIAAAAPNQFLDDVLSKELLSIAQEALKEAKAAREIEATATELHQTRERAKLLSQKKEKFYKDLVGLPGEETTEREKWEMQEAASRSLRVVREQERAEMKQFCTDRMRLLHPEQKAETTNRTDAAEKSIFQQAENIFTQCYRRPYQWGCDTLQFLADQRQIQAEAGKKANEYFKAQGRNPIDVSATEYGWKTAEIAEQLYDKLLAKRAQEKIASPTTARTGNALPVTRDPREPLSFFEQLPIFLKNKNLLRFAGSVISRRVVDEKRESDMRAWHYFQDLGKKTPWVSEFWDKSDDMEIVLQQEREVKRKELMKQAASAEEGRQQFEQWLAAWPKRLQEERDQKEQTRLEQERLAEEAKKQTALEEENRKRQQAEDELLAGEKAGTSSRGKGAKKKKK